MTDGARTYWKKRANEMVMLNSNTERLRPEELEAVDPRQALQRDDDALQQQYARPSWRVDAMPPIVSI